MNKANTKTGGAAMDGLDILKKLKELRGGGDGVASKVPGWLGPVSIGANIAGSAVDFLQEDADKRNEQRMQNQKDSENRQLDREMLNYKKSEDATQGKRQGFQAFSDLVAGTEKNARYRTGNSKLMKTLGW